MLMIFLHRLKSASLRHQDASRLHTHWCAVSPRISASPGAEPRRVVAAELAASFVVLFSFLLFFFSMKTPAGHTLVLLRLRRHICHMQFLESPLDTGGGGREGRRPVRTPGVDVINDNRANDKQGARQMT